MQQLDQEILGRAKNQEITQGYVIVKMKDIDKMSEEFCAICLEPLKLQKNSIAQLF